MESQTPLIDLKDPRALVLLRHVQHESKLIADVAAEMGLHPEALRWQVAWRLRKKKLIKMNGVRITITPFGLAHIPLVNDPFTQQRTTICSTCPYARTTTKEYLDTRGDNGERFVAQAHLNALLPCHSEDEGIATVGVCRQCAGAAKFRANVGATGLSPQLGTLPSDTQNVFATDAELLAHHKGWSLQQAEAALQNGGLEQMMLVELRRAVEVNRVIVREVPADG